MNCLKQ